MAISRIKKNPGTLVALAACTLLAPVAALADGPQATGIAAQHAGLAASGADIAAVKRHLHHALNCLVGPEGEGFDATAGNPCSAAGGAIPQTSDAAAKAKLQKAAAQARSAVAGSDLDATRKAATELQAALK